MLAKMPPLIDKYIALFDSSPFLAVLLGLGIVVVAIVLLRVALRLFLFFLLLLVLALLASYFLVGEEQTNRTLKRGVHEIGEQVEEGVEEGKEILREKLEEK